MKVPVSRPLITAKDTKQVLKSLENLNISGTSSTVQEFENSLGNYLDNKRALCVSSGTSAIDLMIESLFDKRAGNVIVPTFTIMSTVFQLGRKGIRLKLVDCNLDDWKTFLYINFDLYKGGINNSTKIKKIIDTLTFDTKFSPIKYINNYPYVNDPVNHFINTGIWEGKLGF